MNLKPPSGSRISVTTDGAHSLIVVPHGNGGLMRYYVGLFLLVWFGMWFVGFSSAVSELSSGEARASRVFLLVVWTLAAVYAVYTTYRAFRPPVPESLRLTPNSVIYDSGTTSLFANLYISPIHAFQHPSRWKPPAALFTKRTRVELDRWKLQSLRLRETNDGSQLTVDADALRLDIAQSASDIEREWLYQFLANRYSLPSAQARADRRSG